ncbi:MAG TPA: hypothetical protein VIP98_24440, partial [Microlunatus sp.]
MSIEEVSDVGGVAGATQSGGLRHSLRIVRTYLRLGVLNIVQYRGEFWVAVVNAAITLAAQVLGLAVIFGQTAELAG